MAELKVYVANNDLIWATGIKGESTFDTFDGESFGNSWVGLIEAPDGDSAYVYVDYRRNTGAWTITLGPDDSSRLPSWNVTAVMDRSLTIRSAITTIEVPEGTTIYAARN